MGRSRFDATGAPDQHASQAGPLQAGAPGSGSGQVGARFMEGVGTVAFSVAFILILRVKVISVLGFDNICPLLSFAVLSRSPVTLPQRNPTCCSDLVAIHRA
jgi:hypothetical protein